MRKRCIILLCEYVRQPGAWVRVDFVGQSYSRLYALFHTVYRVGVQYWHVQNFYNLARHARELLVIRILLLAGLQLDVEFPVFYRYTSFIYFDTVSKSDYQRV